MVVVLVVDSELREPLARELAAAFCTDVRKQLERLRPIAFLVGRLITPHFSEERRFSFRI